MSEYGTMSVNEQLQREIDRLKAELEEASTIANDNYQVILKCNGQINELKRQLAEAKTANLAIRSERDQAVAQLHAELAEAKREIDVKQRVLDEYYGIAGICNNLTNELAEAKAELERLTERLQANAAKIDEEDVVIEWADYLELKAEARQEAARGCYEIARTVLVLAMKRDNFIGNAMDDLLDEINQRFGLEGVRDELHRTDQLCRNV